MWPSKRSDEGQETETEWGLHTGTEKTQSLRDKNDGFLIHERGENRPNLKEGKKRKQDSC
jgi:Cu/Zn superoxide dismutase